jgi:hypothetical protein
VRAARVTLTRMMTDLRSRHSRPAGPAMAR